MASDRLSIIFGTVLVGKEEPFIAEDYLQTIWSTLQSHGVTTLDTAQLYCNAEQRLGEVKAGDIFTIDTKWLAGWVPGSGTKDTIVKSVKASVHKLGVDIFYLHSPDAQTNLEETLEGVNEAYNSGLYKRFGLSNFSASEAERVYNVCKANNWILPTVYQGNYSPVARLQETLLFPTLRELDMAFYAYSPLAGGLLTKTAKQIEEGVGRFGKDVAGGMYRDMYNKPSYLNALTKWERIAQEEGVSRAELAYRWVSSNSQLSTQKYGDAIVIGASSLEQLRDTLDGLAKGPLSEMACAGINEVWEDVKHDAPLDNFNR
ncbi:uncharacterized protein A1O5_09393 [Cladophialophora psammophila CBS 110553]|uniref:NADP-dependent oxidoreductase domain-containing protein n=1 Tax=Cladophialophora psammophila CBS 110553 TaxID=1182543 RepID=W9WQZ0_9EURO|nr:uncharacterized protein A1O5_09393 [Cladophialophora psammophila CBS 110553]EXJ67380.1 hypothetical protein A1O5_09393 [Cladophialophora psammophila CBS 110553]